MQELAYTLCAAVNNTEDSDKDLSACHVNSQKFGTMINLNCMCRRHVRPMAALADDVYK